MADPMSPVKTRSMDKASTQNFVSSVIKDMLTNKSFVAMVESHVDTRLREMQLEVEKHEAQILDLEFSNKQREKEIDKLKSHITNQGHELQKLKHDANQQEQYSRRNCLRFFGLEQQMNERTDDIVISLASDVLGIPITKDDIERSHRVKSRAKTTPDATPARPGHASHHPPDPIIVKFKSYRTREMILKNRRKLAGSRKSIQEDLTAQNAKLLRAARNCQQTEAAWLIDGRIFAIINTPTGKTRKLVASEDDLKKLCTS